MAALRANPESGGSEAARSVDHGPAAQRREPARDLWILAAILLLALVLRVVYVLQMRANPYFANPQVDQRYYVDLARDVARGHVFPDGVYPRAPLYAWWLGAVFAILGDDLLTARLLQALVGTASVALLHRVTRRVFGARAAHVAAVCAATYWVLIYFDGEFLREPLANAANLLAILLTLRWLEAPGSGRGLFAGLAWGVSALLRQQVLLCVLALALWIAAGKRASLRSLATFALAVIAPIVPITLHNALAGDWVLISPEGGQALWIANNPAADGVTAVAPGMRRGWEQINADGKALAEQAAGRALRPSEVSSHFLRKTWSWITSEPASALKLLASKARLLVSDFELGGNPEEPWFFAERFAPVVRWLPLGFGMIAALAVLGLWTTRGGGKTGPVLWIFLATYAATTLAFLVSARHRAPILPMLCAYAGVGAIWLWDQARARAIARLALGLAACSAVFAVSRTAPAPEVASRANGLWWIGLAEARNGRNAEAIRTFDEALGLRHDFGYLYAARAHSELRLGNTAAAAADFQRAIDLDAGDVDALNSLAELEVKAEHPEQGLALAERSIRFAPHLPIAYYQRGRACLALGRLDEADSAFRAALERNPRYFNAAYALGLSNLARHALPEAIAALRIAVQNSAEAEPEFAIAAHAELVRLLLSRGEKEEAFEHARRLQERFPSDPRSIVLRRLF